jgi:hypothetical protein
VLVLSRHRASFYGDVVEHRTAMRGVPGSILGSGVDYSEPLLQCNPAMVELVPRLYYLAIELAFMATW